MAEKICVVCGESNPEELDFCRSCNSPLPPDLKPIQPGQAPTPIDTGKLEPILPQWLREARAQAQQAVPQEPSPDEKTQKTPAPAEPLDLLAGLQAQANDEEEIPDWLRSLAEGESQPSASSPEEGAGAPPQAGFQAPGEVPPTSPSGGEPPASEEIPDWLASLSAPQEPSSVRQEFADWFAQASTGEQGAMAEPPATPGEEPPASEQSSEDASDLDWLRTLDASRAAVEPPATSEASSFPQDVDLPDWLKGLSSAEPAEESQPPAEEEVLPSWLPEPEAGKTETPISSEEEVALPDWLQGLTAEPVAPETPAPQAETPAPLEETELPDWLQGLTAEPVAPETPAPPPETPAPLEETELPDWLQGLTAEPVAPETPAPPPETPAPLEETELPDWLQGLTAEPVAPETPAPPAETPAPLEETELPEWLSSLTSPASQAEAVAPAPEETPSSATPAFISPPTIPTSELHVEPDWLAGLRGEAEVVYTESAPQAGPEEPPSAFAEAPLEGVEEIFSAEIPDWLLGAAAETPVAQESLSAEEAEESLAPAELPSWVQAMRPVEATISETAEMAAPETQEVQGPLAGLRGVLPVPAAMPVTGKPTPFSIKLQVTEEQQSHMALLDQVLAAETTPQPLKTTAPIRSVRWLRWLLAALLIGITAIAFFAGTRIFAMPTIQPSVFAARDAIVALPEGAPVLLVFDYQPAVAGEMEAIAAPLVDSMIILRHPRLAILSTSPLGADLAERFLNRTQKEHGYQSRNQYVNLGYLPGGLSGVSAFIQNPAQAMPFATDLSPAWQSAPLQGVQSFSDFAAVVVITDSVETGRVWIEQNQLQGGQAPLVLVTSAQAGPMLQPYFQSGQVSGMLSGLYDGAVMERNNADRPGVVRRYWDAYSLGLWLSVFLMAIGAAWNGVIGWREQQSRRR